jgi:hypothetical protein
MAEATNLFLTGCYRSGTTLLEKLLHRHQNICMASQPFPLLYFHAKSAFYEAIGIERRYPLDHRFLEDAYREEDFYTFLDQFVISTERLHTIFQEMGEYKLGLWTPEILAFWNEVIPGTFIEVYEQLNNIIARIFPKEHILFLGSKEVLCEEYVRYLLSKGSRAIIVIRDPRDMITSVNLNERNNLTGHNRPTLYSLRIWRKSVATALACETHPNFIWLRYEDIIDNSLRVLNRVTSFLGIGHFSEESLSERIRDQHGEPWRGNSSFDEVSGISSASVGRYANIMRADETAYIEACCWPEMKALSYDFSHQRHFDESAVRSYAESFQVEHEKFSPDYSCRHDHIEEELERYKRLEERGGNLDAEDAKRWFLYEAAYHKLKSAVARK